MLSGVKTKFCVQTDSAQILVSAVPTIFLKGGRALIILILDEATASVDAF